MAIKVKLESISAFKYFTPEKAKKLEPLTKIIEKNPGEALIIEESEVLGLYLLIEGEVGIFTQADDEPIDTFGPGNEFGEMSLVENINASVSVRALNNPVKLILIPHQTFKNLLKSDFELASYFYQGISHTLSKKLRRTTQGVSEERYKEKGIISKIVNAQSASLLNLDDENNLFSLLAHFFGPEISELHEISSALKAKYPNEGMIEKINNLIGNASTTYKRTIDRDLPEVKKVFIAAKEITETFII